MRRTLVFAVFLLIASLALATPDTLACRMIHWLDAPGKTMVYGSGMGDYFSSGTFLWDMAMGDSFLVWLPGTDTCYLVNPLNQSEVEITLRKRFGSVNARGASVKDSLAYIVGGGFVASYRYRNDSLFLAGYHHTGWASFYYAVIRDTFLYTTSRGSFGLHCINIANPESIFVAWNKEYYFGWNGLAVLDSFIYSSTSNSFPVDPESDAHMRTHVRWKIANNSSDTTAPIRARFQDNVHHGSLTTDGTDVFSVYSEMSDFIWGVQDYTLGASHLEIWGTDYSYTWSEYDEEGSFGIDILNDIILAVGFEHGFSILNYSNLDSIHEVAYYRDTDSIFAFTHFALKDNRMFAMAHPRAGICRMYMFELDSTIWTGIVEADIPPTPEDFRLRAFPNPFNSAVTISIDGVGAYCNTPLQVEIYDVAGRRVACLGSARQPDGTVGARHASPASNTTTGDAGVAPTTRQFTWQPSPDLPSGVYLVRARFGSAQLPDGGQTAAVRVVFLK